MTRTPRNVLGARERLGNWAAFPVSPAPYFARLHATYLTRLPESAADLAMRELARVIAELRRAGLEYQRDKAHRLRGSVLQSATRLEDDAAARIR